MIKVIMFDLSGVLLTPYDDHLLEWISKKINKSIEEIWPIFNKHIQPAERGEISEYQSFEEISKELNLGVDALEIQEKRKEATSVNPKSAEFIQELKKQYKVMFATNNAAEEFTRNYYLFELNKIFHSGKASYQLRARKPTKEFFEKYIEFLGVKPEEIVFTDDNEMNLVSPKELGIHVIHFKNIEQFKEELKKI